MTQKQPHKPTGTVVRRQLENLHNLKEASIGLPRLVARQALVCNGQLVLAGHVPVILVSMPALVQIIAKRRRS